jgi:hypothetical protein
MLLRGTIIACAFASFAAPILAGSARGRVFWYDWAIPFCMLVVSVAMLILSKRNGVCAMTLAFTLGTALAITVITGAWSPTLKRMSPDQMAQIIRFRFGERRYCFYGTPNLPLGFCLRAVIPSVTAADQLRELTAAQPELLVLVQVENNRRRETLPDGFTELMCLTGNEKTIVVFEQRK